MPVLWGFYYYKLYSATWNYEWCDSLLLHRIILAILFPHMYLIIVISNFVKTFFGILVRIALNLYYAFGRMLIYHVYQSMSIGNMAIFFYCLQFLSPSTWSFNDIRLSLALLQILQNILFFFYASVCCFHFFLSQSICHLHLELVLTFLCWFYIQLLCWKWNQLWKFSSGILRVTDIFMILQIPSLFYLLFLISIHFSLFKFDMVFCVTLG